MKFSTENRRAWYLPSLFLLSVVTFLSQAAAQTFTLQIGASPLPSVALVNSGDIWRYRPARTNAPQVDWRTDADAALDGTWLSAPGGFGFGDPGIVGEATTLSTMLNNYSSLAIRREFSIAAPVDPARRIQLTVDYDDGYVAWLDGVEIARSPNAIGVGNPPPYNAGALSGPNHEASCCGAATNTPSVLDLGPVGALLAPGTHVLAIQGINAASNSSDFHLIADLALVGGTGTAQDGVFFSLVNTNSTVLSGTNTLPGATRVAVNGVDAAYNPGTGEWSRTQPLQPGMNRLFIAALDAGGNILYATNRDVVAELATRHVGGRLPSNEEWGDPATTIRVTNDVIVSPGNLLFASNGVVVLLSPGVHIIGETNALIRAYGIPSQKRVHFLPADGTTPWGRLGVIGTNAELQIYNAELVAGQVRAQNGGIVSMQQSIARDLDVGGRVLIEGLNGGSITVRSSHLARYVECDSSETPTLYEDCLLEQISTDGLDLKGTNVSIVVRRCTLRFGAGSNTDAVDFGPGPGSLVEDCLIHDFGDKGVSVAARTQGSAIRNSVIYGTTLGISCDSTTNIYIVGNTIVGNQVALNQEAGGAARVSQFGTNNILWGNATNSVVPANGSLALEYSDTEGGVFPGTGNISADPLFVDAAGRDYRLQAGSPAIGTGLGGANMGVSYPVGGIPSSPFNLSAHAAGLAPIQLWWREGADNENGFEIQRTTDGVNWTDLATTQANATNYSDTLAVVDQTYFYRLRASNPQGKSDWSNLASARRGSVINIVCGTLAANTTWSPAQGEYLVCSNLTVPTNVTLTILPGTVIRLTNASSIRAIAGGSIDIAGTEDNKVVLQSLNPGVVWKELSAQFTGASLTVRHADISGGQVTVYSNAVGLIEDSFIHDYRPGGGIFNACIMLSHFAAPVVIRRCHVREYHETLFRNGVMTIEDCLFERIYGDGLDFDAAQPGTVLRRCTFRHGNLGNVDAVDVGPADLPGSFNVLIADCLMYDFPFDKGVSVGDNGESFGTVVSNCLIYACQAGIMAKDSCDVTVINCTVVSNRWGFTNYNKNGSAAYTGGYTTNYNSILWNNITTVSLRNGGTLTSDHSILGNTNWPGTGNFSADPLFLNPLQQDYRLQPGSPAIGAGRNGATLGASYPVGAAMALSHPRIDAIERQGAAAVLRFWADNEKTYSVLCSDVISGGTWAKVADVGLGVVPRRMSITNSVPGAENRFYRLVTPQQP
jgi:Right handed beta helix region